MAAEIAELFVGYTDVHHVPNTQDERQLASIIAAAIGVGAEDIHEALVDAELSESNGLTGPLPETRLGVGGSAAVITPVHSPFGKRAESPEGVLRLIDEQHEGGKAVAMLHKTSGDPADGSYHWTMLTGYYQETRSGGSLEKGGFHVIDPSRESAVQAGRNAVLEQIKRSMDFMDIYVCTVEPDVPAPDIAHE